MVLGGWGMAEFVGRAAKRISLSKGHLSQDMQRSTRLLNGDCNLGNFCGQNDGPHPALDQRRAEGNAANLHLRSLPQFELAPRTLPLVASHPGRVPELL